MNRLPNLNNVTISGRLVADPEVRYTPKGTAICSFRIAVSRFYKDKNTDKFKEATSFFNIVVWDAAGETASARLKKGSPVVLEGMLQSRSYDTQDGHKRYVVEINVRKVHYLESAHDKPTDQEPEDWPPEEEQ